MFIDAFEIAFIVIPILTPVAVSMEVDLLWFGVIIGMILQTSFLTPPFGLALSYLRSVAPKTDGVDRKSGLDVKGVSTAQIYAGCIPFIALQILATAFVIYDPSFVLGPVNSGKAAPVAVDADTLMPPSMDTLMPPMSDLSN
jgi:TRAP-type mannitol/chloroaromatic compound transport system permease large subunit